MFSPKDWEVLKSAMLNYVKKMAILDDEEQMTDVLSLYHRIGQVIDSKTLKLVNEVYQRDDVKNISAKEEQMRNLQFTVERLSECVEKLERQMSKKADKR